MATFHFRRKLSRRDELRALRTAAGAAVGAGVAALYLARIWFQRTPMRDDRPPVVVGDGLVAAAPGQSPFELPSRRAP